MTYPEISTFGELPFGEESRGVPVLSTYPNDAIWVDTASGSDLPQMGSFSNPFKSFAYALTQASDGDMIIFKAGNTVTLSSELLVSINDLVLYTPFSPLTLDFTGVNGSLAWNGDRGKCIGYPIVLKTSIADVVTGVSITGDDFIGSFIGSETAAGCFADAVISLTGKSPNVDLTYTTEDQIVSTLTTLVDIDGSGATVKVQANSVYTTGALVQTQNVVDADVQILGNNARSNGLAAIFEDTSGNATYSVKGYHTVLATGFKGSNSTGLQFDTYLKTDFRTKSISASEVPNNVDTLSIIKANQDLVITDITLQTGGALAGPTNILVATDNAWGLSTLATIAIADLGANKTVSLRDVAPEVFPMLLDAGKSIFVKGDDAAGSGPGKMYALVMYSCQQTPLISAANA